MDRPLRLPARLEFLDQFQAYAKARAALAALPENKLAHAELVLEEILVNVIKYAYPGGPGDIELSASADPEAKKLTLSIRDFGPPFDPLSAAAPDLGADMDQRPVGGLGLYLVQRLADSVTYQHAGDSNLVEVVIQNAPK